MEKKWTKKKKTKTIIKEEEGKKNYCCYCLRKLSVIKRMMEKTWNLLPYSDFLLSLVSIYHFNNFFLPLSPPLLSSYLHSGWRENVGEKVREIGSGECGGIETEKKIREKQEIERVVKSPDNVITSWFLSFLSKGHTTVRIHMTLQANRDYYIN